MEDEELLRRVTEGKDFMRRLFLQDSSDDWAVARQWAELALRIDPEDLAHHLALARACRHLGDTSLALEELAKCTGLIERGNLGEVEQEVIVPMVEQERRLLLPSP